MWYLFLGLLYCCGLFLGSRLFVYSYYGCVFTFYSHWAIVIGTFGFGCYLFVCGCLCLVL